MVLLAVTTQVGLDDVEKKLEDLFSDSADVVVSVVHALPSISPTPTPSPSGTSPANAGATPSATPTASPQKKDDCDFEYHKTTTGEPIDIEYNCTKETAGGGHATTSVDIETDASGSGTVTNSVDISVSTD